jgi:hypothetical protein
MILYMSLWELIQVIAYNQAFILVECIVFTFVLVLIASLLPVDKFKNQLVYQGMLIALITVIGSILFNQMEPFIIKIYPAWFGWINQWESLNPSLRALLSSDSILYSLLLIILLSAWLILLVLSPKITQRLSRWQEPAQRFAERISILSGVFVFTGSLGCILVLINNLR